MHVRKQSRPEREAAIYRLAAEARAHFDLGILPAVGRYDLVESCVRVYQAFADRFLLHYGKPYARTLEEDWIAAVSLVRMHGSRDAKTAVIRAFQDKLLANAGIERLSIVEVNAHTLLRVRPGKTPQSWIQTLTDHIAVRGEQSLIYASKRS